MYIHMYAYIYTHIYMHVYTYIRIFTDQIQVGRVFTSGPRDKVKSHVESY